MNFLFFLFLLGACFLGLTYARTITPEEAKFLDECEKKCKVVNHTCRRNCSCKLWKEFC
ncbi:unnamed protein product [Cylicocyclus nassatus]|uniref:Uncharacterized protein n=1 Tax=Cylicocyclus nassatus TaxID=53992 RepID=A0AA36H5Y9_CYLNA|nr:unnamed protein product [Cylicocyclus nassatus]